MDKRNAVTKRLIKRVRHLIYECPKHDADEIPNWLDDELALLSIALSDYNNAEKSGAIGG